MIDILVQGALLGGLYTLFALGQSLMFGVMRLTNTAQGDFIVLGAFAAVASAGLVALHPALIGLALLPIAFVFGYALQRYVLNGTLGRDPLPSLVVTFGLAPIVIKEIYGAMPAIVGEGMSVVIVEQDIGLAQRVSQRVVCLQEGRVSLEGLSGELTRDQIAAAYFGLEETH